MVITLATDSGYHCELWVITNLIGPPIDSVFEFRRRPAENTQKFNVILLIPTGIGAEIGGMLATQGPSLA
jgi:hypothetical protein